MKKITLLFCAISFFFITQLHAMMVMSLNIEQLTALAEKIFVGKCVSVVPESDAEGRRIIEVIYDVSAMIKGPSASRVSFRQLAPSDNGGQDIVKNGIRYHSTNDVDLPHYEVGNENLIFLSEDGVLGLTAPIGIEQGKFDVKTSLTGEKRVVNTLQNEGLFPDKRKSLVIKSLSLNPQERSLLNVRRGDVSLGELTSLVRKLVQSQ